MDEIKGVSLIIQAFKGIREKLPDAHLLLVGDGNYDKYLPLCRDCFGKITFAGKVDKELLSVFYQISDVGVMASFHEQCSYVAIEMSMFGMPMIVSDVDALSEMFEDEVNALRIPLVFDEDFGLELDEEKLADAIIRLIDDEALRLKLSTNAIKNYQERFTLER